MQMKNRFIFCTQKSARQKSARQKSARQENAALLVSSQSLSFTASSGFPLGFPPATPSTGGSVVHGGLDPHGKKLAALEAALIELKGYADVLKKDDPTIMATKTTEVIKEVADRLMIPFEDNCDLLLARL
jgi:hypothetical protein